MISPPKKGMAKIASSPPVIHFNSLDVLEVEFIYMTSRVMI
jgi:hypothetical protein